MMVAKTSAGFDGIHAPQRLYRVGKSHRMTVHERPTTRARSGSLQPGRGEIRTERLPASQAPTKCSVRARFSGISRGTEALVFDGRVPAERIRSACARRFRPAIFPAPVKYGYASVGEVEQGPRDLQGRHVFALYPHQTRYVVPAAARVSCCPTTVPPARAVLAANLETAINGFWDARPHSATASPSSAAAPSAAWWPGSPAALPGCEVELVDLNPQRAAIAGALGVRFALPGRARASDADVVVARQRLAGRPGAGAAPGRLRGDRRRDELVRQSARCRWRSAKPFMRGG